MHALLILSLGHRRPRTLEVEYLVASSSLARFHVRHFFDIYRKPKDKSVNVSFHWGWIAFLTWCSLSRSSSLLLLLLIARVTLLEFVCQHTTRWMYTHLLMHCFSRSASPQSGSLVNIIVNIANDTPSNTRLIDQCVCVCVCVRASFSFLFLFCSLPLSLVHWSVVSQCTVTHNWPSDQLNGLLLQHAWSGDPVEMKRHSVQCRHERHAPSHLNWSLGYC